MSERPKGYENTDARPRSGLTCPRCRVGVAPMPLSRGVPARVKCLRCGAEWTAGPGGERR